jgi:hypothetical protein
MCSASSVLNNGESTEKSSANPACNMHTSLSKSNQLQKCLFYCLRHLRCSNRATFREYDRESRAFAISKSRRIPVHQACTDIGSTFLSLKQDLASRNKLLSFRNMVEEYESHGQCTWTWETPSRSVGSVIHSEARKRGESEQRHQYGGLQNVCQARDQAGQKARILGKFSLQET